MIKYFQKLRAKKGFTLVELIVVIAIIGVLAAILIPTMLGYVTQSKVTSANSTAASIKNEIDAFLTQCDTVNKGMKKGSVMSILTVTVSGSSWTVANGTAASFNDQTNWASSTNAATATTGSKGATNHCEALAKDLCDLFPEIQNAQIIAYLRGGKTFGVVYVNGVSSFTSPVTWAAATDNWPDGAKWSNDTQGIATSGDIVGTAPVIPLAATATLSF